MKGLMILTTTMRAPAEAAFVFAKANEHLVQMLSSAP